MTCPKCGARKWLVVYPTTVDVRVGDDGVERVVVQNEGVDEPVRVLCHECLDYEVVQEKISDHPAFRTAQGEAWPSWEFGW